MPDGLVLNPTTCAITGTPTSAFPQTTFLVTATNQYGSTTGTVILGATANPPSNLAIPGGNTQTFTTGTTVNLIPTYTGSVTSCTINPALPSGLVLNPTTCAISGTPTTVSPNTAYTIAASNQFGSTNLVVNIGVNTLAPQNLNYPFGTSTSINTNTSVNITPSVIGGISSCSVSPSLPQGLVLNLTTCAITGTPTVNSPNTAYTITANNQHGSTSVTVNIATQLVAPIGFSFPLESGVPTIYTITATTCRISGTPSAVTIVRNYTITASNSAGNTNRVVSITINPSAPSDLVYPNNGVLSFDVNVAKTISPTFNSLVSSCSSNPSLPTGLSINQTNCEISGTANTEQNFQAYVITGTNSGGSTTSNITIKIIPPPPIISPSPGNFNLPRLVSFTSPNGGVVRCTTDGSEPSVNSQIYSTPIHIYNLAGINLKCKNFKNSAPSETVILEYYYPPIATGQTNSIVTGDDGNLQKGVPRSYTDNGDGTIKDNYYPDLVWQKCLAGQNNYTACSGTANTMNWYDANDYCSNLTLANKTWRIPDINELLSLMDFSNPYQSMDSAFLPIYMNDYLSTTNYYIGDVLYDQQWYVNFGSFYTGRRNIADVFRCVSGP